MLLKNKTLNKIIKMVVDTNNPKEELNYLYYDSNNKKLVCGDTRQMLLIDTEMEYNEDKFVAIKESKNKLLYVDDKTLKYPSYDRIVSFDRKFDVEYDNYIELLQDKSLNTLDRLYSLAITNKRLMSLITELESNKDIKNLTYCISNQIYVIKFSINDIRCICVTMPCIHKL